MSYWGMAAMAAEPTTNYPTSAKVRDPETNEKKVFFQLARYLTFDQSLTNTGWARFDGFTADVTHCGILRPDIPDPHVKGFNLTFEKARQLEENVKVVLLQHANTVDQILIEMPAVTGYRIESSLMAAEKIMTVCRWFDLPRPTMVSRQHAAKVVTGNAKASKRETGDAIDQILSSHPTRPWNEHVRDAALLAVAEAMELDPRPFQTYQGVAQ